MAAHEAVEALDDRLTHRPSPTRLLRLRRSHAPSTAGDEDAREAVRKYAESNGFLTLLSDGQRLTGAYALGPEAGEWLQQATLAIRARVPVEVLNDTIQLPTFSQIYMEAVKALRAEIAAARLEVGAPT